MIADVLRITTKVRSCRRLTEIMVCDVESRKDVHWLLSTLPKKVAA